MEDSPQKKTLAQIRILDASRKIFAEMGFERTTISLICKEAGVNRAMVSYYYGGKLALYREIIEIAYSKFLRELRDGVYNEKGPQLRLRAFIRLNASFNINDIEVTDMISREIGSNFANVGDILEKQFIQILAVLTDVIQEGKDSGLFDKSLPSTEIALFMLGAINSYFVLYRLTRQTGFTSEINTDNENSISESLYRFIMKGISS